MKAAVKSWLFCVGMFLIWEGTVHLHVFGALNHVFPIIALCCLAAFIFVFLIGIPFVGRILSLLLPPLLALIYGVQLIYCDIFGSFLSLAYISAGGEAITTFWTVILASMWRCRLQVILLLLPVILFYLLRKRSFTDGHHCYSQLGCVFCAITTAVLVWNTCEIQVQYADIDFWIERYGVLAGEVLELTHPFVQDDTLELSHEDPSDASSDKKENLNILEEIDFTALSTSSEDELVREISNYLSSVSGTEKNEYTGYFQGYNLIVVCAEAFSPYLIDESLTPTLYRLSTEGFVFQNFYNSFQNLTTNGEYSLCMGLMPDINRLSFSVSASNDLPFCLGRLWSSQWGTAYAYHNNAGSFYNRVNTHTNMGYEFRAIGCGLDMELGTPTSDLEMFEKTVDEYIDSSPFHAYYMTYSGHTEYSFELNQICKQNESLVNEVDGSEPYRAYYACQLELERAMTFLVQRLEEKGIADQTVIVLTGDHMPYGLPDDDYAQLAGQATTDVFWQYRNSFICWNGSMTTPVVVEEYCCTQDILPTILNLFGFSYDSRLLTGRDVLSECMHTAVLKDGSFLTKEFTYNGKSKEISWTPGYTPDEEYAQAVIRETENQFILSAAILESDYYRALSSSLEAVDNQELPQNKSIYTDIAGTWYEGAVEELTQQGILLGNGLGLFNGEQAATRAETFTILFRSMKLPTENIELPYSDTEADAWYYDLVSAGWKAGLFPEEETELRPNDYITSDEAIALLTQAAVYLCIDESEEWAATAVNFVLEMQLQAGCDSGGISRGAVAYLTAELVAAATGASS